jgi:hypothetical protein
VLRPALIATACTLIFLPLGRVAAQVGPSETNEPSKLRGLLASAPLAGQPIKGVYFFPGEGASYNRALYTAHPQSASDLHWNSDVGTRAEVIDRIIAANANTLVMSYWGDDMIRWSPMELDSTSLRGVLDAVQGKPIVVIPALESGHDPLAPALTQWRFSDDFPYEAGVYGPDRLAPRLLERLRAICRLFDGRRDAWAQMYDRRGRPRYVVHVLRAHAQRVPIVDGKTPEEVVAEAFDAVADTIYASEGIELGFTLDVSRGELGGHSLEPNSASPLAAAASVLAIQFFMSEMHGGGVLASAPAQPPIDNNVANLDALLFGKLAVLEGWLSTGIPVVYDVSSGFDGRYVWAPYGSGFWGDNRDYTSDAWRNFQSEHNSHAFIGVTFNTWNGYSEGYAATPTVEHGVTIYDWLRDLYEPDARACNHVEYEGGRAAFRVSGAICEKWRELGGRRGALGPPVSNELTTERGRVLHFAHGSVFLSEAFGAREVHGALHDEYQRLGYGSSCLGLPVSDEEPIPGGWISRFEHGVITFVAGDTKPRATCTEPGE